MLLKVMRYVDLGVKRWAGLRGRSRSSAGDSADIRQVPTKKGSAFVVWVFETENGDLIFPYIAGRADKYLSVWSLRKRAFVGKAPDGRSLEKTLTKYVEAAAGKVIAGVQSRLSSGRVRTLPFPAIQRSWQKLFSMIVDNALIDDAFDAPVDIAKVNSVLKYDGK